MKSEKLSVSPNSRSFAKMRKVFKGLLVGRALKV